MRSTVCVSLAAAALCQGCAMNREIAHDAASYEATIDDLTDRFLVENILQARDKAPLHFVDIATIHETIQTGATLGATVPFGKHNGATTRASVTPGVSIQVSPSFDVSHLDSKDFVTGIASPIDPKFVKYWLDRGLDSRIAMLLFLREFVITDVNTGDTIHIKNSPRESYPQILDDDVSAAEGKPRDACGSSDFSRYLAVANHLKPTLSTNVYSERTQVGDVFALKTDEKLKELTSLDSSKYTVEAAGDGKFKLYALNPAVHLAICYGQAAKANSLSSDTTQVADSSACTKKVISHDVSTSTAAWHGLKCVTPSRDMRALHRLVRAAARSQGVLPHRYSRSRLSRC